MTKIIVDHGEKKQLAKIFATSHVTVREALAGRTKSVLATQIRAAALERGGKETKITIHNA